MFYTDKSGHTEMSNFLVAPELLELLQQLRLVYLEGQVKLIKFFLFFHLVSVEIVFFLRFHACGIC